MNLTATAPGAEGPSHRRLLIALSLTGLVGLVFIMGAAVPYFRLDPDTFRTYWPRRWWLLVHITTGIVALMTGPVQLWLGLTDRRPTLHKQLGMIYLTAIVVSSMSAFYLAAHNDVGIVFGAGLTGLGIAWLVTSSLAFLSIKRQLIEQHKEWMIRSYVVTTAFVTFRAVFLALNAAGVGQVVDRLTIASWFCWAVPLLVTEAWLQGKKVFAVRPV